MNVIVVHSTEDHPVVVVRLTLLNGCQRYAVDYGVGGPRAKTAVKLNILGKACLPDRSYYLILELTYNTLRKAPPALFLSSTECVCSG